MGHELRSCATSTISRPFPTTTSSGSAASPASTGPSLSTAVRRKLNCPTATTRASSSRESTTPASPAAPVHMLVGNLGDLQIADAILVDEAGFKYMWPDEPLHTGKIIEMNDRRAVVVGVYRASQTFMTMPIIYTRFSQATLFVPPSRRLMPFVLAKPARRDFRQKSWPGASRTRPG